ncbi:MAG: glycosyltransferase [Candidatus Rokuibacteriota bacterium]
MPCRNAAATIADQLQALAVQQEPEPWELIVADNGSTDATREVVEAFRHRFHALRIVDASARVGRPHACNAAVRVSRSAALAFCDADDEVAPGWVRAMSAALDTHPFVAGRLDIEKLNEPWARARPWPQQHGLQRLPYPPRLPHAAGCNLGVRRELHDAVGGFDESLARLQDTDYCFRLQLAGVGLHYAPEAVVHYRLRHTLRGLFEQSRAWGRYNVVLYVKYRQPDTRLARPWRVYLRRWVRIVRLLRHLDDRSKRATCVELLGWQVGLLEGALRHRVPPVPI